MLTNKNVNRNDEKIAEKNKVKNIDEFYGFRLPNKNEAIWTQQTVKFHNAMGISTLLIFFIVNCFFLISNTMHMILDGLNQDIIKTYAIIAIFFFSILIINRKSGMIFGLSNKNYDIQILDCKAWSIRKEPNENSYSYYAAICTDLQYSEEYISIQSYAYHCLVDNLNEDMFLVKVQESNAQKNPMYYLQTRKSLA